MKLLCNFYEIYLGIPSDLAELLRAGKVAEHVFEFMFNGAPIAVLHVIGIIGLNGSPPPMASVEYLIFVYSRVLFCKIRFELK